MIRTATVSVCLGLRLLLLLLRWLLPWLLLWLLLSVVSDWLVMTQHARGAVVKFCPLPPL
jgi:hypothetical protein